MVLVDLKGTLKYFPEEGNLYTSNQLQINNTENSLLDHVRNSIAWDSESKIEVIETAAVSVPEYQKDLQQSGSVENKNYNLRETVTNWPDFMYTRYHPKSINIVKEYEHHEEYATLDTFSAGMKVWDDSSFEDDFGDKIRSYMEECNISQGFQTLFDVNDGFSGLAVKCFEYLEDEYSKPIFALPLFAPKPKTFQFADEGMSESIRLINTAFAFAKLSEHSNLFVPLSTMGRTWRTIDETRNFSHISYEPSNLYQTSAILATFLDTASLSYRLKNGSGSLSDFCTDLNAYNRKMTAAKIAMPFPMNEKEDLIDFLDRTEGNWFETLTPSAKIGTDRIIQSITLRGIPKNRLKRPLEGAKNQMKMPAYKCSSTSEMMQLYCQCNNYGSLSHVTAVESRMKIRSPFPQEFFDNRIASNGFLKEFQNSDEAHVDELPVMTAIQNSKDLADTLENLHTHVSRIKLAKIPRFAASGLENEEYKELLEQLLVFKEEYDETTFV
jgi:Tubulin domain